MYLDPEQTVGMTANLVSLQVIFCVGMCAL